MLSWIILLEKEISPKYILFVYYYFLMIFFWETERQSMSGGGADRGRHRIWSRLQALSCQPRAQHGAWTHKPWDHDLSRSRTLNRLSHPGTPRECFLRLTRHLYLSINVGSFQITASELTAQSPMQGSNSRTVRSWPEPKSMLNWLSHPGTPSNTFWQWNCKNSQI